jgi:hypothetical protein
MGIFSPRVKKQIPGHLDKNLDGTVIFLIVWDVVGWL